MWLLTTRSSSGQPQEYSLKPGNNTLGRSPENNIVVADRSASRAHAEIYYDADADTATLVDLQSLNGTFVNRERVAVPVKLEPDDTIRIGEHVIAVAVRRPEPPKPAGVASGTQALTRDALLESLDNQAVLMYEVSRKLNMVTDLDMALYEVSTLLMTSMGADRCQVVLASDFDKLAELGFPVSIAQTAIEQRATVLIPDMSDTEFEVGPNTQLLSLRSVLCVPVIGGDETLALLYLHKNQPEARPFDRRDLQLAIAISHQAALTIQRMHLLQRVSREQGVRQLLQRFVSPPEAEFLLQEFLRSGSLPPLTERLLTVVFADISNSTRLAERMGVRVFSELLSLYYEQMTDIVFANGGLVDKYLGDGIMAVFGMTAHNAEPEVSAVRAALAMLEQLEANELSRQYQIEIGIAVNTGQAVAGYLGNKDRVEFTVLGDTVNVAYGLQPHARPNRVVIGPRTAAAVVGRFNTTRLGEIKVKNRTGLVQAFEVLRG